VVDFRVSETGQATNVIEHAHRMSVFFKAGDFTSCKVLCGVGAPEEAITLAH
jgi:hypothetical protein